MAGPLMGGEMRSLQYTVTVADWEYWPEADIAAADADPASALYADWAMNELDAVMRAAGEAFIAERPRLFRVGLT